MGAQVVVAGNPAASGARGGAALEETVERLRAAGHAVLTVDSADGSALEQAVRRHLQAGRPDAVVVVGGDGTVHAAVNALARSSVPLGLVPAGAGNDVARNLGLPHEDVTEAIGRIL